LFIVVLLFCWDDDTEETGDDDVDEVFDSLLLLPSSNIASLYGLDIEFTLASFDTPSMVVSDELESRFTLKSVAFPCV